ncbi:ead/Ea22-like family protein [Salmonella enterica]|nr:ead/Ea22-like family protein [Salmonella enterica]
MSNIDKQALLVSKAKASVFTMRYISQFEASDIDSDDIDLRFEVDGTETGTTVSIVDECGHAAQIITALLDENLQLQREKDAIEAVALALRDDMQQAREQLESAEKRNAEQREYYEGVIADGSKRIAELESKNSNLRTIAHDQNELAIRANLDSNNDAVEMNRLHKRIAELEAREISLPERSSMLYRTDFHEDYHTVMAYKVSDVIAAIRAAGIKVKGE